MSKSDFILLNDCLRMMFHISLLQREWVPKVHSLNVCSSYTTYFWFAYFIWLSREHYCHITDKTYLPQGFPLVISFELRKWFPNMSELHDISKVSSNLNLIIAPKMLHLLAKFIQKKNKSKKNPKRLMVICFL